MPVIKKLSNELIGRIAAGEVVERPASVVKELVENSIDAGAKSITVELRDGGTGYLRVSDNGCGIPESQARMAFERHATSKLTSEDGLFDIRTLGFRGEALASIAAVSKVTLTTRVKEAAFGTRATVEGGEFVDIRQAASPVGTSIVVENLFFNTPVRLKFLKKPSYEAGLVADYMMRLILSRPDISFRFASQGKTVYKSAGDGKVESALFCVYGREALGGMYRVEGNMNGALISGYVGVGELSRGNRQQQSFFVNGRYFRSAALGKALENGCEGRLMTGRFPMCALYIGLPFQQVDVNVHPNKLEVRFQNEQGVAQAVETLTREALHRQSLGDALRMAEGGEAHAAADAGDAFADGANAISHPHIEIEELNADASPRADEPTAYPHGTSADTASAQTGGQADALGRLKPVMLPALERKSPSLRESTLPAACAEALLKRRVEEREERQIAPTVSELPEIAPLSEPQAEPSQTTLEGLEVAPPRLIGVVFNTYWIFEAGDRLLLIDQHAAHERMLYDDMMKRYENERVSQSLLSPLLVRLTAREHALALELRDTLQNVGFDIEEFDDSCIAIRAIPTLFGQNDDPRELFAEALDEWQAGRGEVTRERMRRQIAQMACKRAIKGGDSLNEEQLKGFLEEMLKSESMPTCPHGRPIVTEITRLALEKRFKRVL